MKVTFVRAKSSPAAHAALCFAVVVVAVHVAMRGEPGRERASYWCPSCQPG